MPIEEYFGEWSRFIDLKETDRIVRSLSSKHKVICPRMQDIFKAFKQCSPSNLRVVLLAQDPYPTLRKGNPTATGLAFANAKDTPEDSYSQSLDVLKESVIDYTIPHRTITFDPSLEKWAMQGVLLLNSALTCEVGKPGSHALLWRPFTKTLLTNLQYHSGIVYVLMGTAAQSFEPYINTKLNHVVRIRHPAWYARQKVKMPSSVWKEINEVLINAEGQGIEWFKEV